MSDPAVYAADKIPALLVAEGLGDWFYDAPAICRRYKTEHWPGTLLLVNTIGFLCEQAWHHADLHASYGELVVELSSHDAGGITDKDLELAQRIEQTVLWRPDQTSPLDGNPGSFVEGVPEA